LKGIYLEVIIIALVGVYFCPNLITMLSIFLLLLLGLFSVSILCVATGRKKLAKLFGIAFFVCLLILLVVGVRFFFNYNGGFENP